MKPDDSKIMPKIGHPITTNEKPAPNATVPCCTINKQQAIHVLSLRQQNQLIFRKQKTKNEIKKARGKWTTKININDYERKLQP